jgi:hypothetical protein
MRPLIDRGFGTQVVEWRPPGQLLSTPTSKDRFGIPSSDLEGVDRLGNHLDELHHYGIGFAGTPCDTKGGGWHFASGNEGQSGSRVIALSGRRAKADSPSRYDMLSPLVERAGYGPDDGLVASGAGFDEPVVSPRCRVTSVDGELSRDPRMAGYLGEIEGFTPNERVVSGQNENPRLGGEGSELDALHRHGRADECDVGGVVQKPSGGLIEVERPEPHLDIGTDLLEPSEQSGRTVARGGDVQTDTHRSRYRSGRIAGGSDGAVQIR